MFLVTQANQVQVPSTLEQLCSTHDYTVLFFYPKDNSSGCTQEAKGFNDMLAIFEKHNTQIVGVSKDSHESHCKFQQNHSLQLSLISDAHMVLLQDPRFDARKEKSMFGRKYMGVVRKTFILDRKAKIVYTWDNVSVAHHAQEVLHKIQDLSKTQ